MRAILTPLLATLAFGCAALMVVPAALGYHRYVIVSGSMSGSYDKGSIVYAKPVPVRELEVGDTITYAPPASAARAHLGLLTHRIVWIGRDRTGARAFRTRGDANPVPDAWRFVLERPRQDRVVFSVPYAGYAFAALGLPWVRMLLLGPPALLAAASILRGVWRRAGDELARRETLAAAAAGE